VLRGWAGEALLDSYEPERRPLGLANAYRSTHPEEFKDFDGLAFELGARYESPAIDGSGAGTRAPHAWLQPGISTIDRFDDRLTLLTGRLGSGWRAAAARLAVTGLPIVAPALGRDWLDPDDRLASALGVGLGGAVLVRPDGFLAWRAEGACADPEAALDAALATTLGRRTRQPVPAAC
jgi:hypothetical protein